MWRPHGQQLGQLWAWFGHEPWRVRLGSPPVVLPVRQVEVRDHYLEAARVLTCLSEEVRFHRAIPHLPACVPGEGLFGCSHSVFCHAFLEDGCHSICVPLATRTYEGYGGLRCWVGMGVRLSPHVAHTCWRARLGSPYSVPGRRLRWRGAFVHKCVGLMLGAAAFMHASLVNFHGRGMCVRPSMFAVPVVAILSHSSPYPSLLPSHVSHVFGSFCVVALWYAGLVRRRLGNIPGRNRSGSASRRL